MPTKPTITRLQAFLGILLACCLTALFTGAGTAIADEYGTQTAARVLRETSGPTLLRIGTIDDGGILKRSSATIVSGTDGTDYCDPDSSCVYNEAGADKDYRWEGDTDPNLLTLDGGNDNVTIGAASDSLYKLKVVGNVAGAHRARVLNSNAGATAYASFSVAGDTAAVDFLQLSSSYSGSWITGVTAANLSALEAGGSSSGVLINASGADPLYFGTNNTLREFIASDGGHHIKSSSAAVSAAGDVALRNNAGVFEVSQNGGAYAAPSGSGWAATQVAALVSATGATAATHGIWSDNFTDPGKWYTASATNGTNVQSTTLGGGVVNMQSSATVGSSIWKSLGASSDDTIMVPTGGSIKWGYAVRFKVATAVDADTIAVALQLTDGADDNVSVGVTGSASTGFYTATLTDSGGARAAMTSTIAVDTAWHSCLVYHTGTLVKLACDGESAVSSGINVNFADPMKLRRYISNGGVGTNRQLLIDEAVFVYPTQ